MPCRLDLFLLTALDFSSAVMLAAFAAGTHFGYDLPLFFDAFFRPHGWYLPSFFLAPISTQFSPNHLSNPVLATGNSHPFSFRFHRGATAFWLHENRAALVHFFWGIVSAAHILVLLDQVRICVC
jgi:hypothetical protein